MTRQSKPSQGRADAWLITGPSGPREWASIGEAAEEAGVSESTVRRWVESGVVHGMKKVAQRLLVDMAMVREHIRPRIMGGGAA